MHDVLVKLRLSRKLQNVCFIKVGKFGDLYVTRLMLKNIFFTRTSLQKYDRFPAY